MSTTFDSTNENENVYNHFYIHDAFSNFLQDTLQYFSLYLYPRFQYRLMGTYDKAVQYILNKSSNQNREIDKPNLPAIILNPGDFGLEESGYGKALFRFPNYSPLFSSRLYDPIYQDKHIKITPTYARFQGELELIMLAGSFYELVDIKTFLLQIFNGLNRYIHPVISNSYLILPPEIINYEYYNSETGLRYTLDWTSANATQELIKTTNKDEMILPCVTRPLFKLNNISDGSSRYGGTDKLADYRLTASITYEIELPWFIYLLSDYLVENIQLNIRFGSSHSNSSMVIPDEYLDITKFTYASGLNEQTDSELNLPDETTISEKKHLIFKTRYYHIISSDEVAELTSFDITLPEAISDKDFINIRYKNSILKYGDNYTLSEDGTYITIIVTDLNLRVDDLLELFIYQEEIIS